MPTLPSGPPAGPEARPHLHREIAESFGSDAERYDRARPRYPQALVERIAASLPSADVPGASAAPDVLDVGVGTGIAARQFQAAGCRVLGIDPDPRMAEVARKFGIATETGTFEEWDPAGRDFAAVVAGQAWHWVDPVAGAAKAARVLRPGGRLAAFWNAFELPPDLAEATAEVCSRAIPDAPVDFRAMTARSRDPYDVMVGRVADGIRRADGFGAPERWDVTWEWTYDRDTWLDQVPTHGVFTRLPPAVLEEVLAGIGAAVDAAGGAFTMRYTTVAATAVRELR